MTMPAKWATLAGDLLELASDKFSNHGCNDFRLPESWTHQERQEFLLAMHDANESNPDIKHSDPWCSPVLQDYWVMSFLADKLREADRS